jgi:hypothetical protein
MPSRSSHDLVASPSLAAKRPDTISPGSSTSLFKAFIGPFPTSNNARSASTMSPLRSAWVAGTRTARRVFVTFSRAQRRAISFRSSAWVTDLDAADPSLFRPSRASSPRRNLQTSLSQRSIPTSRSTLRRSSTVARQTVLRCIDRLSIRRRTRFNAHRASRKSARGAAKTHTKAARVRNNDA